MIYENMNKTTVTMLSKAKQSHNCILSNNFKFSISQIFKTLYFFFYTGNQILCSFLMPKKNQRKSGHVAKTTTFFVKKKQKQLRLDFAVRIVGLYFSFGLALTNEVVFFCFLFFTKKGTVFCLLFWRQKSKSLSFFH